MIPELGNFALCVSLAVAIMLSLFPLIGTYRHDERMINTAKPLSYALFISSVLSFGILIYLLIVNDFSVDYVLHNSNRHLPIFYRIAAAWGAHEGSLLLWVTLLSCWTLAVALFSRQMPKDATARVLSILGMINVGFVSFTLFSSNPFARTLPFFAVDGYDLNPLLQDVGLIFHPPLLYMGYVGFSVAFAFAIASLLGGHLDTAWARWSRPWTLVAWIFLTLGITLGSFWAYYELGWGGWWFWDPVENASLMPWLSGTALLHSLAVTEKRATFKAWTVLLAITTFSLCLLGTFIVRSGIMVSVHAFASDPTRGMFILGFLVFVVGGSLFLYAWKGKQVNQNRVQHQLLSRENALLINNILLMTAMLVVLLGTLLPLVHKQLGLGSISIGEPFFNNMFMWIMIPFALVLGIGPLLRWRRDNIAAIGRYLILATLITAVAALAIPALFRETFSGLAALGIAMAAWVISLTAIDSYLRATHKHPFFKGVTRLSRSHWGMVLGHLGVAMVIVGVTFSHNYSAERDVRMKIGDTVKLHQHDYKFNGLHEVKGPNYTGHAAEIIISHAGKDEARLSTEKRYYRTSKMVMTEAAIDGGLTRDLYTALGEELKPGEWSVRLYYKPFVRWIWYGGLAMAIAAILCLSDRRYRLIRPSATKAQ